MSRVPVQTRLAGYKRHEETDLFQLVFNQEINYFNFRSLSYEEKVLDVFDVTDCIADPANKQYFDLYVKFDGEIYYCISNLSSSVLTSRLPSSIRLHFSLISCLVT